MKMQTIIIGFLAAFVVLYFIWVKFKNPQADKETSRLSQVYLSTQEKQNDKLVIVSDISDTDLQKILTNFCGFHNKESYQVQPRLTKISEKEFAITFPFDIEFEIFCYFVNYVHYPMGFDKSFNIIAWTTTKKGDTWITENSEDRKAMLFIPSDDKEYDNVFMTTADNIGFKLGFALGEEKQLLDSPKKQFIMPTIDILALANKEHKDFK
jgi:hypothetical protein